MNKAFFIAGTDTGVGKTLVGRALLHKARAAGLRAQGFKPIAAGTEMHAGIDANADAWHLLQESTPGLSYADVNPVALHEPMAPHIAAEREDRVIALAPLVTQCQPLIAAAEFAVIEGAGGWDVPLNDTDSMADLAALLNYPVILVVGMRLGCLNHALLTAASIKAHGVPFAGWVANRIDRNMPVVDENIKALSQRLTAPLIGTISFGADVADAAAALELDCLKNS